MQYKQPYADRPDKSFWRRSIADRHATGIKQLFSGMPGLSDAKIATGGSCFAQHIGKALRIRGMKYLDYEKAPIFLNQVEADRLGYGVYSCRYGNIYTVRQLLQLAQEVFGGRVPKDAIWLRGDRYYDALRPGLEPDGFGSRDEVCALRSAHLSRVKSLFQELDVFIFTLGLTEAWVSNTDGTVYPIAPGVVAGHYSPAEYSFVNFRYPDIYKDMASFINLIRSVNPSAKFLFTVSPVPLAATATDDHVLVATTYSKSVLRAAAGDLAADIEGVYYFPSYEVITGQPSRHMYYNPDLRTVCQAGVNEVMRHFFADHNQAAQPAPPIQAVAVVESPAPTVGYEHCEEALLDPGVA